MVVSCEGAVSSTPNLPPSVTLSSEHTVDEFSQTHKLHGRAFYESLGSPKFVLAPMVDQSEFVRINFNSKAWRMLTRSYMTPSCHKLLAYSPMFHARMFGTIPKYRDSHFQPLRNPLTSDPPSLGTEYFLDGNPKYDRPLFVQFCANNAEEFLAAAKYVTPYCDAVDLNLGCPQGIAKKGRYGAFLQEDQKLIYSLINTLHRNLDVPVTAKIRILETREKTLEYALNLLEAGASILTIHGRTRDMKGHKTGLADWQTIRFLRDNLPKETVLFANGNILRHEDILQCLQETGADAVMSAEGNLYDPTIFAQAPQPHEYCREYWRGIDGSGGWRVDAVFRRYIDIIYKYVLEVSPPIRNPLTRRRGRADKKKQKTGKVEKTTNPNLLAMQPHLFHILRPLVAKHHNVRDALAKCRAGDLKSYEAVLQMVEEVVRVGLEQYHVTNGKSWKDEFELDERLKVVRDSLEQNGSENNQSVVESSVEIVRECKRPWWIVQPHVRPLPQEALAKGSWALNRKEKAAQLTSLSNA
ncbi:tRNA-dihydrouridine synthase C [Blumeria hordei DH14]|uniref:tRNA-dihydrouridine(16/17) synthase [NAD(P)(+)] n=1 Tax=Blumeria graminis f. sp. hordei (strain DH14) TaxID=546991 RepID=N1JID9_BLUG1|nr:tRNA-dihydrouridine synthase C [Blumeria hordei DH14]